MDKNYKLDISFGKENFLKLYTGYYKSKDSSLTNKKWIANNLKSAFYIYNLSKCFSSWSIRIIRRNNYK